MSERSDEDWGRVAVSLPGWRWAPGMLQRRRTGPCMGSRRIVDSDFRTTGNEPRIMGGAVRHDTGRGDDPNTYTAWCSADGRGDGPTPGRAIVALAESLGHWPGGMT